MNKLTRRMLTASAMLLFGSIMFACGAGQSAISDTITPAQFNTMLAAAPAFTSLSTAQKTLSAAEQTDATDISRIALIGHVPGVTAAGNVYTRAVARAVDNTDYGICTNMGEWAGHGPVDIDGSVTDYFKQCTGNKFIVNSSTGAIAHSQHTWYASSDCSGAPIMFVTYFSFDRSTMQGGIVFESLFDNSVWWVQPSFSTPAMMTANSQSASSGVCSPDNETHPAYQAVANVTDGNNGSGVPNGGVPNNYVYN